MTDEEIFAIKVGDKLLLTRDRHKRIDTVTKVTRTQIITNFRRYSRVHSGRTIHPGKVVGGLSSFHIERIATADDIARQQREEAAQQRKRQDFEDREARRLAKITELSKLFAKATYVSYFEFNESGDASTFTINDLTEKQVIAIAGFLKSQELSQ